MTETHLRAIDTNGPDKVEDEISNANISDAELSLGKRPYKASVAENGATRDNKI